MKDEAVPIKAMNRAASPKRYVKTNKTKIIKASAFTYDLNSFQYQKLSTNLSPSYAMDVPLNAFIPSISLFSTKFSIFLP